MKRTYPVDFMKAVHIKLANKTGKLWSVKVSIEKGSRKVTDIVVLEV